jgi:hypothetical protein
MLVGDLEAADDAGSGRDQREASLKTSFPDVIREALHILARTP